MHAQSFVWWPGISRELINMVTYCGVCTREASLRKEPMMASPLPDYPWQVVGSDLFTLKNTQYLLVVDYFSRYPEIVELSSTTSTDVITALKTMCLHGLVSWKLSVVIIGRNIAQRSSAAL